MTVDSFNDCYAILKEELMNEVKFMPKEAQKHIQDMVEYTLIGGKMNRGLSVLHSFRLLIADQITKEQEFKANALGWCVEWLQAMFLVADDIMDHSKTRRGRKCWYLMDNIGHIAINDAFILESCIYLFLKKYFRDEHYYVDLLELFHSVTLQTELGQLLDLITAPEDKVDLNRFSMERFTLIVQYKTSYYSFYLPVALAMLMAGITDKSIFKTAQEILIPLGNFFQAQDDYLDCFGDPETIGKIGTDIMDNKCSWLINHALKLVTPEQRTLLENNYGRKDKDCESKVKQLFKDLNLPDVYQKYEEQSYSEIMNLIKKVDNMPQTIFIDFANRIYKRNK